jgi:uncharacterized protein (TIGR02001 family)
VASARRRFLGALFVLAPLGVAPAACSQVAASATVTTDYLYRGLSLSDGRPALDLSLLYDDKSGFYAGGSLIGEATRHQGLRGLGHQEYAGYAIRLRPDSTLDLGVSNLHYRSYGFPTGDYDATEIYAGWVAGNLNYYLHYSPNYFRPGANALYGEINGAVRLPRPLRLFGHVGVLTPLGGGYDSKERYDLRAGVAASFKRGEVQLAWTTAQPFQAYADPPSRGRGVVSLGLTWFF